MPRKRAKRGRSKLVTIKNQKRTIDLYASLNVIESSSPIELNL